MSKQTKKKAPTAKEILTLALSKLNKRGAWIKGRYHADSSGASVPVEQLSRACHYCAMGAVDVAACELRGMHYPKAMGYRQARKVLSDVLPSPTYDSVEEFNDRKSTRKVDILSLFQRAIKKASVKK
jgi:hypothetical protein